NSVPRSPLVKNVAPPRMTVTSTVPGPGEVSCAYARDIIRASLGPIRPPAASEGQAPCLEEEPRKHKRMSLLDGIGVPGWLSGIAQAAFLCALGSAWRGRPCARHWQHRSDPWAGAYQ